MITRRSFLSRLASAATATAVVATGGIAAEAKDAGTIRGGTTEKQHSFTGSLHSLGTDGHLYPGIIPSDSNTHSVLTSIDLPGGKFRQTALPMGGGHSVEYLGDNRLLCIAHHRQRSLIVDEKHNVIRFFDAPENYVYGGHGLVLKGDGKFLLTLRHAAPKSTADKGLLEIYDLKTAQLIERLDSGGLHPHELHVVDGTDEIAGTHYGDILTPKPPFEHNVVEAKLTVYDAKTLKPKRHYDQTDLGGMATHMKVNGEGEACFVLTQYIRAELDKADIQPNNHTKQSKDRLLALTKADAALQSYLGHPRTYPMPYEAEDDLLLPVPLPFVRVNLKTGERHVIMTKESQQLRSQSVGYNKKTNTSIAVFYHSNTLILDRARHEPEVVDVGMLGISEVRGICEIPGTTCIGLVGAYRGLVIYDLASRNVVDRYSNQHFNTVHLTYMSNSMGI